MPRILIAAASLVAAMSLPAYADGDPVAGKVVFKRCAACHDATEEKNKIGPHLVGVVGRPAGSVESYAGKYSANMKEAAAAGLVWDEENLEKYLHKPKEVLPKGTMAFAGLPKEDDIENVIAYLKADPKP